MGAERLKYFSGSALNVSAQRAQQKKKSVPACQCECFAVAGFTLIPQTGSRCGSVAVLRGLVDMNLEPVTMLARACVLFDCLCSILDSPHTHVGETRTD
jgi:hypothetical protein